MGKNEQVNYSQSIRVSNSQSTSQVDNSQSACQVDNSQSTRVDNSQSTARLGNSQSTQVYNSQSTSQLDNGQSTRVNNSQSTSQVDKSQSTVVDNSQFTSQVENSQSTQVDNNQPTSQVCPEMDKLAEEAVAYCQENNISNPSEILRVIQNKFVKGRNLQQVTVFMFPCFHSMNAYINLPFLITGLSILQNGKLPRFLEEEILEEIFSTSSKPNSAIQHLQNGLKCLGIHQIGCQLPMFLHLLRRNPDHMLTVKQLVHLLKPEFSPEGSNSRSLENKVYAAFVKYMREVASGRRHGLSLSSILTFVTGTDEEPVLGFHIHPSIQFHEVQDSFLPSANTCIGCLRLPRPALNVQLPATEVLFSLYDMAFLNTFFGTK